jgi:hypothetical protein
MKISVGIKIAAVVLVLLGLVGSVAWINADYVVNGSGHRTNS